MWAYRARQVDPLVEVSVLRIGTQRPPRVLVRFLDEVFEGREEWVPPGRLKVLWEQVEAFQARQERWDLVTRSDLRCDDPREDAAERVFEELIDEALAEIRYGESGVVRIADAAALAHLLGFDPAKFSDHPHAFVENGVLIAPWDITELVAMTAARRNPEPILNLVTAGERKAQYEAIYGHHYRAGRDTAYVLEPEQCVELDNEYSKPVRELLRTWCGSEAIGRFDELAELRKEIRRVGAIAEAAISALRAAGNGAEAAHLQRDLGTPVEMLRLEGSDGHDV